MDGLFLKIVNMSITAGWLILAVIAARPLLKRAPRWISCALWGSVALRLMLPFSFRSMFSLVPSTTTVPYDIALMNHPVIDSGMNIVNETVNPTITSSFTPDPVTSANPLQILIPAASVIWITGTVIMLAYALISYMRVKRSVAASIPSGEGAMVCDDISSPFILGVFSPVIYLPSSLEGNALKHVMSHETAHIKRLDHIWKPLGFLILSVYWFSPLCWIAYILLCRDIESACDERVIKDMDRDGMAEYSQTLLECSLPRRRIAACPLAFGETSVKDRVKQVLSYRKPALWIIAAASVVCIAILLCLMTDPFSSGKLDQRLEISMDRALSDRFHVQDIKDALPVFTYDVLGVRRSGDSVTVYATVWYEEYVKENYAVRSRSGCCVPAAVTFDTSSDTDQQIYPVKEYFEPRDGGFFVSDIRSRFPVTLWRKAISVNSAQRELMKERCLMKAGEYYRSSSVDPGNGITVPDPAADDMAVTQEELDRLRIKIGPEVLILTDFDPEAVFLTIMSSPAQSSVPMDYLEAHEEEHKLLLDNKEATLRYIFWKMLKGGQTDLRGHLMRIVLDELAPESKMDLQTDNAQQYFDEWIREAIRMREQHDDQWLIDNRPVVYMFFKMLGR